MDPCIQLRLLSIIFVLINSIACEEYVPYKDVGMEYKLHKTPLIWPEARIECQKEDAELAMPENQKEADIIKEIFNSYPISELKNARKQNHILLGFHDLFKEGEYVLENGDSIQYAYRNWNKGEPNNGRNENCGSMTREGYIDDFPCHIPSIFICQKETSEKLMQINEDCKTQDFEYKYSSVTRHCYKLHTDPRKWAAARAICKAEGSQLAVINSQEEEETLLEMVKDSKYEVLHVRDTCCVLIGFHDLFHGGQYVTIEGHSLESSGFVKWAKDNPSHSRYENCGSLDKKGGLNDFSCDIPAPFICERSTDLMVDTRIQE